VTDDLQSLVSELVASGAATAVSALIGNADRPQIAARAGWRDEGRSASVGRNDRFDLASLSKPWTATLALALARRKLLPLDTTIGEVWTEAPPELARHELADLLAHRAGMAAWRPLFHLPRSRELADRLLEPASLGAAVPTYSDLGYVLWGRSAERVCGARLIDLLEREVLRPLGISTVGTRPDFSNSIASRLGNEKEVELAAEQGIHLGLRGAPPPGTAQDGNARFLGAFGGHAGLFAPARALWRLGSEWLRPSQVLDDAAVKAALAGRGRYALGWWRRSAAPAAAKPLSASSFGHHGFTGGSLWIDPKRDRIAVLLAHRSSVDADLDPWRQRFHSLEVE
jgi:CubicO group peptidase (beta-lactamase class C family)